MKVFPYLRVSSRGQCDGLGFDRQREHIAAWVAQAKAEVAKEYQEQGVSGTTDETNRPAFAAMVEDAMASGVKTVVVESLDRFARDLGVQLQLLAYLKSKGISLISATTGEDITAAMDADPMRRAMVQMQGIFCELEKNLLVRKLRMARQRKKAQQGWCEAPPRFGDARRPEEAGRLERIRQLAAFRRSPRYIAEKLNQEGLFTRKGKTWNPGTVCRILKRMAA